MKNKITIDNDNYFEIAEALHCYLSLNHEGQNSLKYELLCRSEFNPSPLWTETRCIKENNYYHEITENNFDDIFRDLEYFLQSDDFTI